MRSRSTRYPSFILGGAVLVGCDKSTEPGDTDPAAVDEDVAVAVAGYVSEEGGGLTDQMDDAAFVASSAGIQLAAAQSGGLAKSAGSVLSDTSYDDVTGWWTATLSRSRSSLSGTYESSFDRVYQFQFLNSAGSPQRRYIVQTANGPDTAYVINFKIVSGSGYFRSPIRVHYLESLTADWVITNANTPVLTINGTTAHSGKDTLTTRSAVRTHANTITTTLTNVTKPRYRLGADRDDISGTITGHYEATITFSRGDLYSERTVSRDFTIDLSVDDARVGVGGKQFKIGWKRGDFLGMIR